MATFVIISVDQLADCLAHGKWFDGSALEGFARVAESDMYLIPDVGTFTILPDMARPFILQAAHGQSSSSPGSDDVVARVICHVRAPAGEPLDGDARAALLRALDMA